MSHVNDFVVGKCVKPTNTYYSNLIS